MPDKVQITESRRGELEIELNERKTVTRPEILERLQFAKSLGDLKENAEYHNARDEQGKNEDRIKEIEHILKYAEIIEKSNSGEIGLASTAVIQKVGDDTQRTFTIVGPAEADMVQGKLSSESPIGRALLGKRAGDTADVVTPNGATHYTIITVE